MVVPKSNSNEIKDELKQPHCGCVQIPTQTRSPLFDQKVTTLSSENELFESYYLVLNGNSLV